MRAAMYARFSTERQSESSIEDQLRECELVAKRQGFTVVARFSDAAMSGGTAERLNADRVPSPGSVWNRSSRRSGGWLASAIAGDARRGHGILNSELYIGPVIWNRFQWQRLAVDSRKRRMFENPRSTWIVHEDERLRIVPDDLWQAVKRRQQAQAEAIGDRVRKGLSRSSAKSTGRLPKYLLSGLLRCGTCGSSLVVSGGRYYACSTRVYGGPSACANDVRIKLDVIEPLLLDDLKQSLRAPNVIAEARRRLRQRLQARSSAPKVTEAEVRRVEREVANLTDAIASGALRRSPALAARLQQAEDDLARLQAEQAVSTPNVERLITGLEDRLERVIENLERLLTEVDVERARQEVRALLGQYKVEADEREIRVYNEQGRVEAALLKCIGADARNYGSGGRI